MNIQLILVGKTSFSYLENGIEDYEKRIKRYAKFSIVTVADESSKKTNKELVKKKEGERILNKITDKDFLVLLDDKGKEFNSIGFAKKIVRINEIHFGKRISFVVGGAYGFSNELYARANEQISLSKLTFSHQIIRLIFMEQLYRAHTIIKGEPYHHE